MTDSSRRYAGFWIRFGALIIDEIIVGVATQVLLYTAMFLVYLLAKAAQSPPPTSFGDSMSGPLAQFVAVGAAIAVSLPYYVALTHYRGATLGKQLLGIEVIDEATGEYPSWGQSTGRYFAKVLSALLMFAGFLMVAFNREKKGLHDVLAGTVNIHREDEVASAEPEPSTEEPVTPGPG